MFVIHNLPKVSKEACIACRYGLVREENCSLCSFLAKGVHHADILVELKGGRVIKGLIQSDVPARIFHGKPLREEDALSIVVCESYKIPDEPVGITNLWLKLA